MSRRCVVVELSDGTMVRAQTTGRPLPASDLAALEEFAASLRRKAAAETTPAPGARP